jgi:hypothetical protein
MTGFDDAESGLISTLSCRVRCLTIDQAGHWKMSPRRLRALESAGWIESYVAAAHPMIPLEEPLLIHSPDDNEPALAAISRHLMTRFDRPLRQTRIFIATNKGASWAGGYGGRRSRPAELSHDIHLAQLYIQLEQSNPRAAWTWQPEAGAGQKKCRKDEMRPDALIDLVMKTHGRITEAWEMGGRYTVDKLKRLKDFCESHGWRLLLW